MSHWLSNLPSEVAYGLASAAVLAVIGWLWARAKRTQTRHLAVATDAASLGIRALPRPPQRFVNRTRELAALDELRARSEAAATPLLGLVSGLRGVGKTAVAGVWVHRNHSSFPDGTLWADFSRRRHPDGVDVADVLGDFLRVLGVADVAMPVGLDDRQSLFATLTAERRMLVLLDDVDQAAQVLALMPSGGGSLVLVTSGWQLEELVRHGAIPIPLRPLNDRDARTLLCEIAGAVRIESDPQSTDAIIDACGGLPIALCVCGAKLAVDDGRTAAWLAAELGDERRLEVLSPEGDFNIADVFSIVYRDLDRAPARLYRLLGLHPGRTFTASAASSLADLSDAEGERLLAILLDAFLLGRDSEGRLRPHDLVREHMHAAVLKDEPAPEQELAVGRCVDWYTACAQSADRAVYEDRLRLGEAVSVAGPSVPWLTGPAEAFAWFEGERHNVLAAQRAALEREWDERVWQIAEALWPLCATQKRFDVWIDAHRAGVRAGERLGDERVVARMRSQLARGLSELGDHDAAREEMRLARDAAVTAGDQPLLASVTEFGGVCLLRADLPADALPAFAEARQGFLKCELDRGVALQDYHAGWCLIRLGEPERAMVFLSRARDAFARLGDAINEGRSLVRQAEALLTLEQFDSATSAALHAIDGLARAGLKFEQAEAYEVLALSADATNARGIARERRHCALRLYQELGHPRADVVLRALDAA